MKINHGKEYLLRAELLGVATQEEAPLPSESHCLGQSWPSWNGKDIGGAGQGKETIRQVKFFPLLHHQASRPTPKCQLPSLAAGLPLLPSQSSSNWLHRGRAMSGFY